MIVKYICISKRGKIYIKSDDWEVRQDKLLAYLVDIHLEKSKLWWTADQINKLLDMKPGDSITIEKVDGVNKT